MRFKGHQDAVINQDKRIKKAQSSVSLHVLETLVKDDKGPEGSDRFESLFNDSKSRKKKQEKLEKEVASLDDCRHMTFMPGLMTSQQKDKLSAMGACNRLYNEKDARAERAVTNQVSKESGIKKICPFEPELIPRHLSSKAMTESLMRNGEKSPFATMTSGKSGAGSPKKAEKKKKRPASARPLKATLAPLDDADRPKTNMQAERMKMFSRQKIKALGNITLDQAKSTWNEFSRPGVHNAGYVESYGTACDTRGYLNDGVGDKSRVVGGVGTAQM